MLPGTKLLWATPVARYCLKESEYANLLNDILLTEPNDDERTAELSGHDTPTMNQFQQDVIVPFLNSYMEDNFKTSLNDYNTYHVQKWIAKGEQGHYAMRHHNHRGSAVSAVFYAAVDPSDRGPIVFIDPRSNANRGYPPSFAHHFDDLTFHPEAGDLLVFPSFLWHYVYPSSRMRIAIPFDLFLGSCKV